jgi:hypothetical protein
MAVLFYNSDTHSGDSSYSELFSLVLSHFLLGKLYIHSWPNTEHRVAQSVQWLGNGLNEWRVWV